VCVQSIHEILLKNFVMRLQWESMERRYFQTTS